MVSFCSSCLQWPGKFKNVQAKKTREIEFYNQFHGTFCLDNFLLLWVIFYHLWKKLFRNNISWNWFCFIFFLSGLFENLWPSVALLRKIAIFVVAFKMLAGLRNSLDRGEVILCFYRIKTKRRSHFMMTRISAGGRPNKNVSFWRKNENLFLKIFRMHIHFVYIAK